MCGVQDCRSQIDFPDPSCSKLIMSLVDVLIKLWSLNMAYNGTQIFLLEKKRVAFAKCNSSFFSLNTRELDIALTRTVNILTTNKLVKLTMLWTTGPRFHCLCTVLPKEPFCRPIAHVWGLPPRKRWPIFVEWTLLPQLFGALYFKKQGVWFIITKMY